MTANNDELRECREAFEKWADEYALRHEPNYSLHTEFDVFAAWQAAWNTRANEAKGGEVADLTDDDIERLSLQAGWEGNRKYMTKADFHIWCDRMRAFALLASPCATAEESSVDEHVAGGGKLVGEVGRNPSRDRASAYPGGMECMTCGCVFVGDESHEDCGVCAGSGREAAFAQTTVTIALGCEMFRFESFQQWVNKAQSWFKSASVPSSQFVCIDATGRICGMGKQFMSARDRGAFPVTVYNIDPSTSQAIDQAIAGKRGDEE